MSNRYVQDFVKQQLSSLGKLGFDAYKHGDYKYAASVFRRAVEIAEKATSEDLAHLRGWYSETLRVSGFLVESIAAVAPILQRQQQEFSEEDVFTCLLRYIEAAIDVPLSRSSIEAALTSTEQYIQDIRRYEWEHNCLILRAKLLIRSGNYETALNHALEALVGYRSTKIRVYTSDTYFETITKAKIALSDLEGAERVIDEWRRDPDNGLPDYRAKNILICEAELAQIRGLLDTALQQSRKAHMILGAQLSSVSEFNGSYVSVMVANSNFAAARAEITLYCNVRHSQSKFHVLAYHLARAEFYSSLSNNYIELENSLDAEDQMLDARQSTGLSSKYLSLARRSLLMAQSVAQAIDTSLQIEKYTAEVQEKLEIILKLQSKNTLDQKHVRREYDYVRLASAQSPLSRIKGLRLAAKLNVSRSQALLYELLSDPSIDVRREALLELSTLREVSPHQCIAEIVASEESLQVRAKLIELFSVLDETESVSVLEKLLFEESTDVFRPRLHNVIIDSLKRINSSSANEAIIRWEKANFSGLREQPFAPLVPPSLEDFRSQRELIHGDKPNTEDSSSTQDRNIHTLPLVSRPDSVQILVNNTVDALTSNTTNRDGWIETLGYVRSDLDQVEDVQFVEELTELVANDGEMKFPDDLSYSRYLDEIVQRVTKYRAQAQGRARAQLAKSSMYELSRSVIMVMKYFSAGDSVRRLRQDLEEIYQDHVDKGEGWKQETEFVKALVNIVDSKPAELDGSHPYHRMLDHTLVQIGNSPINLLKRFLSQTSTSPAKIPASTISNLIDGAFAMNEEVPEKQELWKQQLNELRLLYVEQPSLWQSELGLIDILENIDDVTCPVPQENDYAGTVNSLRLQKALNLGLEDYKAGDYEASVKHYRYALELARRIDDKASEGLALHGIGHGLFSLSQFDESLQILTGAVSIRRNLQEPRKLANTLYKKALVHQALGQYLEGLQSINESIEALRFNNESADASGQNIEQHYKLQQELTRSSSS